MLPLALGRLSPEYLAQVKREFSGIKSLFAEYQEALGKIYTLPNVPEPK